MAITNHERVGQALERLKAGLGPFAEREFSNAYQVKSASQAALFLGGDRLLANKPMTQWDVAAFLKLMWEAWNEVFRKTLGPSERSLVQERREVRNRWAHQGTFSTADTYRALDSAAHMLTAVSAPQVDDIEKMKLELLLDEQVRGERRRIGGSLIETAATGALKPWREAVTPHTDVASGRYQQAEFAADLWQVHLGEGSDEYKQPKEFFCRTYLTESLKRILLGGVQRSSARAATRWCSSRPTSAAARLTRCWRSTTCAQGCRLVIWPAWTRCSPRRA